MEREEVAARFTRQVGGAFAAAATTLGILLQSGAPVTFVIGWTVATLGLMLFLFWGVPSSIDVLAHWKAYREARDPEDDFEPEPPPPPAAVATARTIAVHGRSGESVISMVEFQSPHEQAWRAALARILWAALNSGGSLTVNTLERYTSSREDVVKLTDVLRDAGLVVKAPGRECQLVSGMTFHRAIRRVTWDTAPLPLPAGLPPTVKDAPTGERSELVPTGHERSELYAQ